MNINQLLTHLTVVLVVKGTTAKHLKQAKHVSLTFPPSTNTIGSITFPRDFDIFLPDSDTAKPWTNSCLYGAQFCKATLVRREEKNQPPYWSFPSR